MNTPTKALLLVILIATAAFFISEQLVLTGTPININFGDIPTTNPYDTVGKYYIAEFDVAGDSAGLVFVPKGLQYEKDRLELKISSIDSFYKAPLTTPPTYLQYRQVKYIWGIPGLEWKNVDYRDVDLSAPFIHTSANVQLSAPGNNIVSTNVIQEGKVGSLGETVQTFVVTHEGVERTIYVVFDNLVFKSGDLPPAGDYAVFRDHVGNEYFVRYDHLSSGTGGTGSCYADDWNDWNCYVENSYVRLKFSDIDSYEDYCNWMYSSSKIIDKCPSTAEKCYFMSNELLIRYPSAVYTQDVTVYVPEELAEFIMLVKQVPDFRFDSIERIETNEGDLTRIDVTGTALGSGTINLRVDGEGVASYSWSGGSEKRIVKGESYTFTLYVRSPQVTAKTDLSVTIYSQSVSGVGETTQVTFINTVDDTTGVQQFKLTIKCVDSNKNIVSNAGIYVDNEFAGYGDITKSVVKGNHYVHAENVTGWYSGYPPDSPKFVNVDKDLALEIPFTIYEPKEEDDYTTLLIIGGIAIVVIILLSLIAREFDIDVTVNHVILLIILVVLIIIGYIALSVVADMVKEITDAIENFKLLG